MSAEEPALVMPAPGPGAGIPVPGDPAAERRLHRGPPADSGRRRPADARLGGRGRGRGRAAGSAARVRCGPVPPLAEGFGSRPETAPGLAAALVPGALVALIPASAGGAAAAPGRPESGGKTQLAAFLASSLWESGDIDLLFWVQASSRASVLSGYVQAAAA